MLTLHPMSHPYLNRYMILQQKFDRWKGAILLQCSKVVYQDASFRNHSKLYYRFQIVHVKLQYPRYEVVIGYSARGASCLRHCEPNLVFWTPGKMGEHSSYLHQGLYCQYLVLCYYCWLVPLLTQHFIYPLSFPHPPHILPLH